MWLHITYLKEMENIMKKKLLAIILLLSLALSGCGESSQDEKLNKIAEKLAAQLEEQNFGKMAEFSERDKYYFTFETTTVDGETWNSDNFANSKITMINVWGTYCNPCLAEMPFLGELAAEYDAAEFQVVGVVCDIMEGDSAENIDRAKVLIEEAKAAYPHLLVNDSVNSSFMQVVSLVPTTFFVRSDGSLAGCIAGAMEKESWKALIDDLLSKKK